jgi:PAS domain S-box-containing protein
LRLAWPAAVAGWRPGALRPPSARRRGDRLRAGGPQPVALHGVGGRSARPHDRPLSEGVGHRTQASYIPDVGDDGEVRGFFVLVTDVTDITERRRIERELERSYDRLAEAERLARLGSWDRDIPRGKMTCSNGLFEIHGISAEDLEETYEVGSSKYVHPDDRGCVNEEMRQAVETGAPVDFEYRIIRPDGRVRRLHSRAELVADAEGHPLRLTGTAQDVTELRAAAEVLEAATDLGRRAAELHSPSKPHSGQDLTKLLTPHQIEIIGLVAEGLSNAETPPAST